MTPSNTYSRIFKAFAILKSKLITEKLSDEKLNQITGRLDMLYQENQTQREALKKTSKTTTGSTTSSKGNTIQ